jgi:hypothetical protein
VFVARECWEDYRNLLEYHRLIDTEQAGSDGTGTELRVDDGPPPRLGPRHLENDANTYAAAEEVRIKRDQIFAAWAAWRTE